MNGVLRRALEEKQKLEFIYMADEGKISQRVIRVVSIKEETVLAYCYTRKTVRTFKLANILSVTPYKESKRYKRTP
ncbi:WYL domain-containing protein [Halobacillus litoralis]|uniref:WYL domain-containing protein n=1 Tax=Halobacillus litoralis TaxID=45668 RepID=UPI001CFEB184|nr:WYL domain-containing protein [Halobacillus litoralis]WLR46549.1 WYL domain-containing protein [Halobacillus litoralis]